jgi:thiazole synthase ThiGH ThiG subunit
MFHVPALTLTLVFCLSAVSVRVSPAGPASFIVFVVRSTSSVEPNADLARLNVITPVALSNSSGSEQAENARMSADMSRKESICLFIKTPLMRIT